MLGKVIRNVLNLAKKSLLDNHLQVKRKRRW